MLLLSALLVGVTIGLLSGGRPRNLLSLGLRWNGLIFAALFVQLVISTLWLPVPIRLAPPLYVLSDLIAVAWLWRNLRIHGILCIVAGACSNLAAIVANGGRMPVDGALLSRTRGAAESTAAAFGQLPANRVLTGHDTRLVWLTDRLLLPAPPPLATVFSAGDVLIGIGAAWLIVAGMRRRGRDSEPAKTELAA